ncbi:Cutinase transcription factor 1 alpha [Wickerhamomyces ciferrii]|uniref:Cutinase transcription factor 1 alpha n=1 Tax=Wickerhamomyces ciferrii (strain ATCC 14091 / BCRC 22168 / CBS 111 / JCM 3599 / NBRC 0793 / NRRL Y-1031 F-60-10) TaxID=1206466 RepID=K0KQU2_WICCF|nr:Cutinase transcription factor 1 alpha [Wickerhamomyces ciferrii]CCH44497.1 Cutinase transcription factor 1 alpha [Wickerhamomyces ciferrii]
MKEETKEIPTDKLDNKDNEVKNENPAKKYSVKFKRSRSTRACEVCHSRKVRCDAMIHIPCTNCLTFGCECKFPEPKVRKNAKKNKNDPKQNVNNQSISTPFNAQLSSSSSNSIPLNKQDQHHQQPQQSVDSQQQSTPQSSKKKNEPVVAVSAQTAKIDQAKFSQKMASVSFIGTSSAANLLSDHSYTSSHRIVRDEFVPPELKQVIDMTRIGLDTVQMEILKVRGAFLLPEKQLCDDLINTFFKKVWPSEPVIDKDEFMKSYKDGSISILLLQATLLSASRVSGNPSLYDSEGSNYLASCTFYQRAKALYDANYERDPLTLVQSLSLLTKFWEGLDDILGNSYYWTRIAIAVAHGYGFHRSLNEAVLSDREKNTWKVLWWNLYIKDISTSVAFGRPNVIHLEDCDVEMVKLEDFDHNLPYEDAESFIQLIKLSEIMSIVLQEQYSAKAERLRHRENWVITHCDMLMSSWRNNLPSELQYSPTKKFSLNVNCLNLYYYSAVCLVHRSNMVRTATLHGKSYPSEGIVFQASRIIADISAKMLKYNQVRYAGSLIIPTLFIASMTFICHLESPNKTIARTARLGYEVLFKSLEEIGKNYLIAVVIAHNIKMLANDNKARQNLLGHLAKRNINDEKPRELSNVQINPNDFPVKPLNSDADHHQIPPQQQQQPIHPQAIQQQNQSLNYHQSEFKYPSGGTPVTTPGTQPQSTFQTPNNGGPNGNGNLEFPDLYLFTNTLPSSSWNNFNPSELFPNPKDLHVNTSGTSHSTHHHHHHHQQQQQQQNATTATPSNLHHQTPHQARTDSSSGSLPNRSPTDLFDDVNVDGFDPNGFDFNLPEFDFQNFNNSISLQNIASINDFFNPNTPSATGGNQSTNQSPGNTNFQ